MRSECETGPRMISMLIRFKVSWTNDYIMSCCVLNVFSFHFQLIFAHFRHAHRQWSQNLNGSVGNSPVNEWVFVLLCLLSQPTIIPDGVFKFEVHTIPHSTIRLDGHWNLNKVIFCLLILSHHRIIFMYMNMNVNWELSSTAARFLMDWEYIDGYEISYFDWKSDFFKWTLKRVRAGFIQTISSTWILQHLSWIIIWNEHLKKIIAS